MTAVIYARYSSDSQREASIEGQLRDCKDYAERNGITIVGTYIDRAYSAKTDDRPEFQRMVQDSARKIFDAVLVWKLDRFARNRYDTVYYKRQLEKNNVHLVSVMEPISDGPEGIMVESLLIGMAEYYSAELAIKVARGERENALKCKYNGGVVPLGYVIGKEDRLYHIDPETAPIVQEIFTRYADGEPAEKIAASLNERGLRTRTGKPFVKNSFFQIFKNRRYIGEYSYKDIVIPGGVPAIVDQALFDRVQERFAKNKITHGRPAKDEVNYLLTTKLFCGKCGTLMGGESGTSQTVNLVLDTIHLAMRSVKTESRRELQLHSDQGFQYTSQAYFNLTREYNITPSMSRRGNCYDNALAENFFGILKTECIYRHKPETFEQANKMIDDYIYFYNHERIQLKTGLAPLALRQSC